MRWKFNLLSSLDKGVLCWPLCETLLCGHVHLFLEQLQEVGIFIPVTQMGKLSLSNIPKDGSSRSH